MLYLNTKRLHICCYYYCPFSLHRVNTVLHRRPEDWTLSWGGSGSIFGWGHNHRGQLGGVEGAKVKLPTPCDTLTALRPVQLIGGEQTLFAVTGDGKVKAILNWFYVHRYYLFVIYFVSSLFRCKDAI